MTTGENSSTMNGNVRSGGHTVEEKYMNIIKAVNLVFDYIRRDEEGEEGFAALDDKVYGVLLERALQRVRLVPLKSRGVAGETEYTLPEEWDASKVNVYCFATSSNERMVSDSVFVPVTPQA